MRSRLTIVPVLALLGGLSAWAQAPQKFAIINMQETLISTKDGQKAVAALKAKFAPKEQEFQKRQADLQAKQDELRRTENTISEEKKAALARDIDTMTKSLQRDTRRCPRRCESGTAEDFERARREGDGGPEQVLGR